MKRAVVYFLCFFCWSKSFAQNDFTGLVKYTLTVLGNTDNTNKDSMMVVFDKERILVVLYLPDSNRVSQKIFIDDLKNRKSYKVDPDTHTYEVDSLKSAPGYTFKNANSIGQVNRDLCWRYKALLSPEEKSVVTSAECLAAIDYRNSFIKEYSFLGVQPMIVDNRIVMDYLITRPNGSRPVITVSEIQRMDHVDFYFDLTGFNEVKK